MPDSYILTGPGGGTSLDVASFTQAGGVDFGARDLLRAQYVEGAHTEGRLAFESTGVRRMSFPLIVSASRAVANLGMEDLEALLRKLARPGATLDLRPQGATTAVRFNVLAGRWEPDYNVHQNREGLRLGTLRVETEPLGYWPTAILLGSAASIGLPGFLTWSGSIIGDAPGLAKLSFQPTVASNIPAGSWLTDFAAFAITHRASHLAFLAAPSLSLLAGASLLGEAVAPASQSVRYAASRYTGDWSQVTRYLIASALEPAYRGRYRAFAWARVTPSQVAPWQIAIDAVPEHAADRTAFASYAPIATVAFSPTAMELIDLGELTLPAAGSGLGGGQALRVWMAPGTWNVGIASPVLGIGGLFLLPLDSDFAGIMPRGLAVPSVLSAPSQGRLMLGREEGAIVSGQGLNLASAQPWANGWQHYRGPLPLVASGVRLDVLSAARRTFQGALASLAGNAKAMYRFEEHALTGVGIGTFTDAKGSWHGSYAGLPALQEAGALGYGGEFNLGPSIGIVDRAVVASVLGAWATSFSIQIAVKNGIASWGNRMIFGMGPAVANNELRAFFGPSAQIQFGFSDAGNEAISTSQDPVAGGAFFPGPEPSYHLLLFAFDYASRRKTIFRDGVLVASTAAGVTNVASGILAFGDRAVGDLKFFGSLDEAYIWVGTSIDSDRANEMYEAWAGNPRPMHSGPAHAALSLSYTPRFQFLKGL